MNVPKLFMTMLGCKPTGRNTEQHDIFFGIGTSLADLLPQMNRFWPEAANQLHIDAWREVTHVDDYRIEIVPRMNGRSLHHLFFINLGGYREGEFEEYHYKMLSVAESLSDATKQAKKSSFYKHYGFKGATSHIDDKYGVDVDDAVRVADILPPGLRERYSLRITPSENAIADELHIGYVKFSSLK